MRLSKPSRHLHTAEAADRIALHLSRRIQRTLESVGDSDRVTVGVEVARDLIARLAKIVARGDRTRVKSAGRN